MSEMRDADKRHPDGSWIRCAAPGPTAANGDRVVCAEIVDHDGDHRNGTYRWPLRPVLASFKLTEFQRQEIAWGLDVDLTDSPGEWGQLRPIGSGRTAWLDVFDFDAAIWRVTSSRDILTDNAADDFADAAERRRFRDQAARLQKVVDQLVDAAGGPDKLTPDTRRYL